MKQKHVSFWCADTVNGNIIKWLVDCVLTKYLMKPTLFPVQTHMDQQPITAAHLTEGKRVYHRLFINTPTLFLFQSVITASVSVYVRPIKPAFCQINITSKHTANNDPAQKTHQSLSLHDSL